MNGRLPPKWLLPAALIAMAALAVMQLVLFGLTVLAHRTDIDHLMLAVWVAWTAFLLASLHRMLADLREAYAIIAAQQDVLDGRATAAFRNMATGEEINVDLSKPTQLH